MVKVEGSRLAAQAAVSAEEDVICEGEKTREERNAKAPLPLSDAELCATRRCRWTIETHGRPARLGCTVAWCLSLRGVRCWIESIILSHGEGEMWKFGLSWG